LAVGDVREIAIGGLEGADFLDNTRSLAPDVMPAEPLRLTGPTDRVVASTAEVELRDEQAGRRIVSTTRGTAKTVVWNPWDTGVTDLADAPDAAWTDFVGLEPGSSHTLGVTYRIER